ncbi:hypothetical protein ACMYYO_06840 [Dermacoccaceae bacterium W4C1]
MPPLKSIRKPSLGFRGGGRVSLLAQFPRLSKYDPGVTGEGGLDPLGFAGVADRIAEGLAPGVRARMRNPRFVTLSAVGAIVCQGLQDSPRSDDRTTPDIAFEWLVVEAVVRHAPSDQRRGLPGIGKATAAQAQNRRLSPGTYLRGPRVFGFTGVYRPFSLDARVLERDGSIGPVGEELVTAWSEDQELKGFGLSGDAPAVALTRELADLVGKSLARGESTLPQTGRVARAIATHLAPREAQSRERRVLRTLITQRNTSDVDEPQVRDEVTGALSELPSATMVKSERALTNALLGRTRGRTQAALRAAFDFEECVTAIDHAFRMMLGRSTAYQKAFLDPTTVGEMAPLEVGSRLGRLHDAALRSAAAVDEGLGGEVADCLQRFGRDLSPAEFFDALLGRHQEVQAAKGKLMWLDEIGGGFVIRPPYQNQRLDLDAAVWTHPMRLHTLVAFLQETQP